MRVPDVLPRRPSAFASRFFAAFDQARVRGKILYAWKAADVMDCVEPHEAQDFANTGHGLEQIEGMSLVLFGGLHNRKLSVPKQLVVRGDERQVDLD